MNGRVSCLLHGWRCELLRSWELKQEICSKREIPMSKVLKPPTRAELVKAVVVVQTFGRLGVSDPPKIGRAEGAGHQVGGQRRGG